VGGLGESGSRVQHRLVGERVARGSPGMKRTLGRGLEAAGRSANSGPVMRGTTVPQFFAEKARHQPDESGDLWITWRECDDAVAVTEV
jgi:hypothetical protein